MDAREFKSAEGSCIISEEVAERYCLQSLPFVSKSKSGVGILSISTVFSQCMPESPPTANIRINFLTCV
mgnify:CR=1 FL=1